MKENSIFLAIIIRFSHKITLDDQSLAVIIDQNILISIFQQIFIHSIRIFSYIRKKIQTSDWINNIFFSNI